MTRWFIGSALLLVGGCKGCIGLPDAPEPEPEPEDTSQDDSDSIGEDTSPEPPCDAPEAEPNGSIAEANQLALETRACGIFDNEFDLDFFHFSLVEQSWLNIRVEAFQLGSRADVTMALSSADSDIETAISGWNGTPDIFVKVPSGAASFDAIVRQSLGDGGGAGAGDDFFYELIVSSSKPPFLDYLDELDNGSLADAHFLMSAPSEAMILGDVDEPTDQDWYEVVIPSGRHTLTLDVEAHEYGSSGNFALELYDASGTRFRARTVGEIGWEADPWLEHDSLGDETIYVRVLEEYAHDGPAYWYYLRATLEET